MNEPAPIPPLESGSRRPKDLVARIIAIAPWLLFAVVFATFLPIIRNEFLTYDDPEYITANVHVKNGLTLDSIKWAFAAHGANWHPLTCLSHILDGQVFGLQPWGHHLGNVLFHAINTVLVFFVLRRLSGAAVCSFVVALFFGLHPLRVESVAWASERKDVLSGLFWLLAIWAYARFADNSKRTRPRAWLFYTLSLLCFALGLLSKSMVVTLPCVLLLLDFWPLQRFRQKSFLALFVEKLPYFSLTAAFSVIAYFAQRNGAVVTSLPFGSRLANAFVSYCRYIGKQLWPENLTTLYPYPDRWPLATVVICAALLLLISAFAFARRDRQPFLLVGWLWFVGTLVPVIGLIQIGAQSMADRYTYIPCLGLLMLLVWGGAELVRRFQLQTLAAAAIGISALLCVAVSCRQISYWANTQALFQRAVDVTTDNTLALVGLGACLADAGKTEEAIDCYRRALKVAPAYYESHYNLGMALARLGRHDEAIAEFRAALKDRPGVADAFVNLGTSFVAKGNLEEATAQFTEAARLNPADPLPHDNLAVVYAKQGRLDDAILQLRQAIKLQSDDSPRHSRLGELLQQEQRLDEAIVEYRESVRLDPNNADAHNNLGTALGMKGQLDSAIAEFRAALKSNPEHARAKQNLARALEMLESQNKPATPPAKP